METEQRILKIDSHHSAFNHFIGCLRHKGTYTDVTLVCNGKFYPLHKLVLAFCSDYFSAILEKTEGTNPMVILTGIQCSDLELLLDCMYIGEVNVRKDKIPSLMKAAELLRVKDIVIQNEEPKCFSYSSMSEKQSPFLIDEITSTDLSARGSCTPGMQNPDIVIKQEQGEDRSIQEHSFENMEEAKGMPRTDFLDIFQAMNDDPLSISDCDGSDMVRTSRKENNTTSSCLDDSRITVNISNTVAEIHRPVKKQKMNEEILGFMDITRNFDSPPSNPISEPPTVSGTTATPPDLLSAPIFIKTESDILSTSLIRPTSPPTVSCTTATPPLLSVVSSTKGVILAIYQGREYMRAYTGADTIDCHCVFQKEKLCNARIVISQSEPHTLIRASEWEHTHIEMNEGEFHADAAYQSMLQMALDTDLKPLIIYTTGLSELSDRHRHFLKTKEQCTTGILRIRKKHREYRACQPS